MQLRPYQDLHKSAIRQALARVRRVLAVAPTGSGNRYPPATCSCWILAKKCKVEGCDRTVDSHGLCGMHAQRFRRYGDASFVTSRQDWKQKCREAQLKRLEGLALKETTYKKLHGRHEHRVVAERTLGRKLTPDEVVHHIDGNRHNNHPDNLQVLSREAHADEHLHVGKVPIEWNGESLFAYQWAARFNISYYVFQNRKRSGWSMDRIQSTPVRQRVKRNA